MKINERHEKIIALVNERRFLKVSEISRLCGVSEMTIRRDLETLDAREIIKRTYGGAVSLPHKRQEGETSDPSFGQSKDMLSLDKMDVIIASSVNPYFDNLLVKRAMKKDIPISRPDEYPVYWQELRGTYKGTWQRGSGIPNSIY